MSKLIRRKCDNIEKVEENEKDRAFLEILRKYKETRKKHGYSMIVTCDIEHLSRQISSSSSIRETSASFDAVGSVSQARANESDCNNESSPNKAESPEKQAKELVWKPINTRQEDLIKIGKSGRTWMKKNEYNKIKFNDYKKATRKILMAVFGSRTLATHTRSGKTCPIYKKNTGRKVKPPLPEVPVNDIKIEIRKHFDGLAEELINESITTKCADEGRKYKNTKATGPEEE